MTRAAVLVARAIFPEVLDQLRQVFEVDHNQDDVVLSPGQLRERLLARRVR